MLSNSGRFTLFVDNRFLLSRPAALGLPFLSRSFDVKSISFRVAHVLDLVLNPGRDQSIRLSIRNALGHFPKLVVFKESSYAGADLRPDAFPRRDDRALWERCKCAPKVNR